MDGTARSEHERESGLLEQNLILSFFILLERIAFPGDRNRAQLRCGKCGTVAQFVKKQGMRFITLFFIIPVIPISGVTHLLQCPVCGTKYRANSNDRK